MVTRRAAITGGLSSAVVAAVAGAAALSRGTGGSVATSLPSGPTPTVTPAPATGPRTLVAGISEPATASTPADRLDTPLLIDWVGGSDIAWDAVSLPDGFVRRVPTFAGRPIEMRTRRGQAVMADAVQGYVREAVAARTDAIIMSINPVWLHWDVESCVDVTPLHERYACLISPIDPAVTAQRSAELGALIDEAAGAGVPVYAYTQPHSADALASPSIAAGLAVAEQEIGAFDPARSDVRFVARVFTRDLPPLREGVEFIDMVHPTPAGAETLADWLAVDISRFWESLDFGR